jgi:hypothetical protein
MNAHERKSYPRAFAFIRGYISAHQTSGYVLPLTANNPVHLVFQTKFQFLQPMLFQLLFRSEVRLGFQSLKLRMILRVLLGQMPEFFVRFHQVRLEFILRVLHQGSVSFVK